MRLLRKKLNGKIETKQRGNMTREEEKELTDLGMVWEAVTGKPRGVDAANDQKWMVNYEKLEAHMVSGNIIHLYIR